MTAPLNRLGRRRGRCFVFLAQRSPKILFSICDFSAILEVQEFQWYKKVIASNGEDLN